MQDTLTCLRDTIEEMRANEYTDPEDDRIMRTAMQAILADYTVDRNLRSEREAAQQDAKRVAHKLQILDDVIAKRNGFMESLVERLDFTAPILRDTVGTPLVQRQMALVAGRAELLLKYSKLTGSNFYVDYPVAVPMPVPVPVLVTVLISVLTLSTIETGSIQAVIVISYQYQYRYRHRY